MTGTSERRAAMTAYYDDGQARLYHGHVLDVLRALPSESVHMCVTSPPYYGLRDYQAEGQIGLEATPAAYIERLVAVFREVRRVLRHDGTCWLNIADSYAANRSYQVTDNKHRDVGNNGSMRVPDGCKPKDMLLVPERLKIALQADGWWVRSTIIWAKRAPMPESVTDRPTSAHEYVFLLAKRERYFYDQEAVREPSNGLWNSASGFNAKGQAARNIEGRIGNRIDQEQSGRNMRNVWLLGPDPYPNAHFATFPREIPRRAILAGTSEHGVCAACGSPWRRVVERGEPWRRPDSGGPVRRLAASDAGQGTNGTGATTLGRVPTAQTTGWEPTCSCSAHIVPATVLDPFIGSGTTAEVAKALGRRSIGIDLNADYLRDHCIPRLRQQALFFQEAS